MAQSHWEADKMLDVYIYDYLLKRNLQTTAKAFMTEGKVAADPVAIDAPGGFLFEWWSVFWDIFIARTNEKHSEVAATYLEAQQAKAKEHQQQIQLHQIQLIQQRQAQLQRSNPTHPSLNGAINAINSDGILGPSTASVLAAKMYEERMKHPPSMDSETSPQLLEASRMALLKTAAANHAGQLVQANSGNVATTLQQIQARNPQSIDIKNESNIGMAQRSLPMDPASIYAQGMIQPKSGLTAAGLNQGVSSLPLKGWPLTGIDQLPRPNITAQMQKPFLTTQSQFQLMSPHQQQQLIAQAQAQGGLGNSNNYGDLDPRRLTSVSRGGLNGKDNQPAVTDGCISSTMHASSPKVRPDQSDYLMKMQQSSQQPPEQLQQQQPQQLQQTNRKRKQPTSSGAANSTGTGNTVGPANSPPSTPSTHTPGDGLGMAGNMRHVNSMPKGLMIYGADGAGLTSSSNQMDDLEQFGDVGSLDDHVESFLSNDDGDATRDILAALKSSPIEQNQAPLKGFSFTPFNCMRTNSKVVCCHFSSDGKWLASAGHENKVVLWSMDSMQRQYTSEEHQSIITDVRFRPNTTQLATSSFDRTVKLWAEGGMCLHTFTGHTGQVTSLDFHPKKTDILCSCDSNGEIRFWSVNQTNFSRVLKGGTAQVRFQPNTGQLLAAAAETVVTIYDVETERKKHTLQGHTSEVHSVCWDNSGEYLASVSQDLVRVWSITTGECIHELNSNGMKFHSCVFHPNYVNLLIIGGFQSLKIWNMAKDECMNVQAHDGLIAALAQSQVTGVVASASHDNSVKLWK